jgi:hypothetical protein
MLGTRTGSAGILPRKTSLRALRIRSGSARGPVAVEDRLPALNAAAGCSDSSVGGGHCRNNNGCFVNRAGPSLRHDHTTGRQRSGWRRGVGVSRQAVRRNRCDLRFGCNSGDWRSFLRDGRWRFLDWGGCSDNWSRRGRFHDRRWRRNNGSRFDRRGRGYNWSFTGNWGCHWWRWRCSRHRDWRLGRNGCRSRNRLGWACRDFAGRHGRLYHNGGRRRHNGNRGTDRGSSTRWGLCNHRACRGTRSNRRRRRRWSHNGRRLARLRNDTAFLRTRGRCGWRGNRHNRGGWPCRCCRRWGHLRRPMRQMA